MQATGVGPAVRTVFGFTSVPASATFAAQLLVIGGFEISGPYHPSYSSTSPVCSLALPSLAWTCFPVNNRTATLRDRQVASAVWLPSGGSAAQVLVYDIDSGRYALWDPTTFTLSSSVYLTNGPAAFAAGGSLSVHADLMYLLDTSSEPTQMKFAPVQQVRCAIECT